VGGTILLTFVSTNIGLAVFNLLPIPPLDGFSVIQGVLAQIRSRWAYEWAERLDRVAPFGPYLLLILLTLGWFGGLNILGRILGPPMQALYTLLLG
jgi:Zn-dependent protease